MDAAPERDPAPRIGEWLTEAFQLFQREWQVWLLHGLIALALPGVVLTLCGAAPLVWLWFAPAAVDPRGPLLLWLCFTLLLVALILAYLGAGMLRTAAKQLRGEPISVRDLFHADRRTIPAVLALMVWWLAQLVGGMLCVVPGVLLGGILLYAPPLTAEAGMRVGDAFSASVRLTRRHLWLYAVWGLLVQLIIGAGGALLVIGYILTLPIGILMLMVGYRDTIGL